MSRGWAPSTPRRSIRSKEGGQGGEGRGPVFVSTEFQGAWQLDGSRCLEPRRAFGWATSFEPARGARLGRSTGRSSRPRSRRCCWAGLDRGAVDHPEAGGAMRARGQGVLTLLLLAVIAARGGALRSARHEGARRRSRRRSLERGLALPPRGRARIGRPPSTLANPGRCRGRRARVTQPGRGGLQARRDERRPCPPAGRCGSRPPASERGSSSYVEYFGGWIAAGWVTRGRGEGEIGIGAEPCAPRPPGDRGSPRGSARLRANRHSWW